jgi:hypothetical protein
MQHRATIKILLIYITEELLCYRRSIIYYLLLHNGMASNKVRRKTQETGNNKGDVQIIMP